MNPFKIAIVSQQDFPLPGYLNTELNRQSKWHLRTEPGWRRGVMSNMLVHPIHCQLVVGPSTGRAATKGLTGQELTGNSSPKQNQKRIGSKTCGKCGSLPRKSQ